MTTTWSNWAGTATCTPSSIGHPRTSADVVDLVVAASAAGKKVKAIGAGHSFTAIGATDGVLIAMDAMDLILGVDQDRLQVTVGGGITLRTLNPQLRALGLAFPNLGDVDPQSITGAISTGTHGTGAALPGISAAVVALELVTADGQQLRVTPEDTDLFAAARVGLGALGIITTVTLQCVPAFLLRADEAPMRLPAVVEQLDSLVGDNDHFEFYWFPHTDRTLVKCNNRGGDQITRAPLGRVRNMIDDELLSNGAFELLNRLATRRRTVVPTLNTIAARALSARTYVDDSYAVFVSPRRVRFCEMEYAVPRDALADCLSEIDRWLRTHDETVSFPVEVRFSAADDIWMSTGHARDNAYIAVHQYHRMDHRPYFRAAEQVLAAAEGRPHWGKLHTLDVRALAERYPRFDDFVALRDKLDPSRTFGNAYLDQVLG